MLPRTAAAPVNVSWIDTALDELISSGSASVKAFLDENPHFLNAQDKNGNTVLHKVVHPALDIRRTDVNVNQAIFIVLCGYPGT